MSSRDNASGIFLNFMITNLGNINQRLLESRGEENSLDFLSSKLKQVGTSYLLIDSPRLIQETRKEYQEQLHGFEFTGFARRPRLLMPKNRLRLLLDYDFSYSRILKLLKVSKKTIQRRDDELDLT